MTDSHGPVAAGKEARIRLATFLGGAAPVFVLSVLVRLLRRSLRWRTVGGERMREINARGETTSSPSGTAGC